MINNDWERFGDEIRRTIQNAVDNRDFSRLNQTVSDTIGKAMDTVSRGMKDAKGAAGVNMDSVFGNNSGSRKNNYNTRRADADSSSISRLQVRRRSCCISKEHLQG